jgi:hypothetical protein
LKRLFSTTRRRVIAISGLVTILAIVAGLVATFSQPTRALAYSNHFLSKFDPDGGAEASRSGDAATDPDRPSTPSQELYDNLAYPNTYVAPAQTQGARNSFSSILQNSSSTATGSAWTQLGPITPTVPGPVTYTGVGTTNSGRISALGIGSTCVAGDCRVYVGAAGGGVWRTNDALATTPAWTSVSKGLDSGAIGSLWVDPANADHVYVGTGEPNGSSDSEAGTGLYETTNGGGVWNLVSGSVAVALNRSIASVAVDPANSKHLFIATAVARHGSSSVNGGRFTPPGAPKVGLYESTDGGATFTLVFSKASDVVDPSSPNGGDFFRGGVSKVAFDPTTPGRVYFSIFDYGLFRGTNGSYEQVFTSAGGGTIANSLASRTEFALAPLGNGKLRIYVGDAGGGPADFYRTDDAGTASPTWTKLSNSHKGTLGFASYNYCGEQCSYDMPVASPAGHPDNVWIGGQMQYDEIFTAHQPSNGRAIQRSTDAGASFTDMTNDTGNIGMHPDQHAIVFSPNNADIAFIGSDGGLLRTSGAFANHSSDCDSRGLSGLDLTDCHNWLAAIPTKIFSLNDGLATIQFQSISVNPQNANDIMGGTQDNGTWVNNGTSTWFESVGGDGGQSAFNYANPTIRVHTYYDASPDVNFRGSDPLSWDWIGDPVYNSSEARSFYVPLIADPKVGGTLFIGLGRVWRTQDNGGNQVDLDKYCNELTGTFPQNFTCGDWVPLGASSLVGTAYGSDKSGSYVVALGRATGDSKTLWTGTRRGRLFVSTNADAAAGAVTFKRIDTSAQPTRFISGIAVDPANPNHAYISYSGYSAYSAGGHVYSVVYNPATGSATWTDLSNNLGDLPITSIAYDAAHGTLYASTDFGVLAQNGGGNWKVAAPGLPTVATYGLVIAPSGGVLYAATHGRGAWRLSL